MVLIVGSPGTRRDRRSSLARGVPALRREPWSRSAEEAHLPRRRPSHPAKRAGPEVPRGLSANKPKCQLQKRYPPPLPVLKGLRSSSRAPQLPGGRVLPPQRNNCVTGGCQHSRVSDNDSTSECLTWASKRAPSSDLTYIKVHVLLASLLLLCRSFADTRRDAVTCTAALSATRSPCPTDAVYPAGISLYPTCTRRGVHGSAALPAGWTNRQVLGASGAGMLQCRGCTGSAGMADRSEHPCPPLSVEVPPLAAGVRQPPDVTLQHLYPAPSSIAAGKLGDVWSDGQTPQPGGHLLCCSDLGV